MRGVVQALRIDLANARKPLPEAILASYSTEQPAFRRLAAACHLSAAYKVQEQSAQQQKLLDSVDMARAMRLATIAPGSELGIAQTNLWVAETRLKVYEETSTF